MKLFDKLSALLRRVNNRPRYWLTPSGSVPSVIDDILQEKNVLVAGTIGSGKSVLVNSLVHGMLFDSPEKNQFILIDLKHGCELGRYKTAPHCQGLALSHEDARAWLRGALRLMEERYAGMEKEGKRKYDGYKLWIVIDETADLVSDKECVRLLVRLMMLGRAAKVGVIAATQFPNRSKGGGLTAELQQNFTAQIGLRCRSAIESRQIIGVKGCETLPQYGYGFYANATGIQKIAVPLTTDEEIDARLEWWREHHSPELLDEETAARYGIPASA